MKPILYSYFRSSCSYRVRIALNLKGVKYEYRPVHLVKDGGQQYRADYLELNPKGEVPFFIDGETKIAQSMAIIDYVDAKYEGVKLFSKKPAKRARCMELCEIINSGIQPLQNLKVLKEVSSRFNQTEAERTAWGRFWMEEGFKALESKLTDTSGLFSLGDKVSAVDCFLVPQVYNAYRFGVEMEKYPNIVKINEHCLSLDEFNNASPEKQPDFN